MRRCRWAELTEKGVSARGGWSEDGGVQLMAGRRETRTGEWVKYSEQWKKR